MTTLKTRVVRLEQMLPHNPFANWTEEEMREELFLICQKLHEDHDDIPIGLIMANKKCRQFVDKPVWAMERNFRISAFSDFRRLIFEKSLPNIDRIDSIICFGLLDQKIDQEDQQWLINELANVDLGDEGPWLSDYLNYSGQGNVTIQKIS